MRFLGAAISYFECLIIVARTRLLLSFFGFNCARKYSARKYGKRVVTDESLVPWRVQRVAGLVPKATCLTQGLVVQEMLSRRGISSELHVGVQLEAGKSFDAHAWTTRNGHVLIGNKGKDLSAFREIAVYGAPVQ